MKVLVAGELNPDLILSNYQCFPELGKEVLVGNLQLTLGSSSAICAVQFARLGNHVAFAANVGADLYGDFCVAALQREGIYVSLVHRCADLKTGITVSITSATDRALITYPGAMSSLQAGESPEHVFAGLQHFHFSSYFLQDGLRPGLKSLFREARRQGLSTSLGQTLVVAKLGAQGCVSLAGGKSMKAGALPIEVVETTGAGDSFNTGFFHARLRAWPLERCLSFPVGCGALSTRGLGGPPRKLPKKKWMNTCVRKQRIRFNTSCAA